MGNPSAASSKRSAKSVRSRTSSPTGFRLLLLWVQRHPFLSLAGVWLIMMLLGWFALTRLTYITTAPLEVATEPRPEAHEPQRVEPHKPATSFGLIIMVSATCAAASGLLARRLRPAKSAPRRAIKPLKPIATQRRRSRSVSPPSIPTTPPIPQQPQAAIVPPRSRSRGPEASPIVTLIPPDEEDSFDWGDISLANRVDVRKRDSTIELPRLN